MQFSNLITFASLCFGLTSASYCPSTCDVSQEDRLALFQAFNAELFSAVSNSSKVASAFATYVSTDLIEHTAAASSYGADVGFLSLLFPTVSVSIIAGLEGCFYRADGAPICTVHYKATPNGANSFITNTTVISDFYRYNGTCIVEHWDSTMTADASTTNPNFPG